MFALHLVGNIVTTYYGYKKFGWIGGIVGFLAYSPVVNAVTGGSVKKSIDSFKGDSFGAMGAPPAQTPSGADLAV